MQNWFTYFCQNLFTAILAGPEEHTIFQVTAFIYSVEARFFMYLGLEMCTG